MIGKLMRPLGSRVEAFAELAHDLIFPKRCLRCQAFDYFICDKCRDLLKVKNAFCCPVCNREMIIPTVCLNCRDKSIVSGLWIVSDYNDELIKKSIHLVKYNFCEQVGEVWEKLIMKYFDQERFWLDEALLVPVPLHNRRQRERGFNQAMIVAQILHRAKGNAIYNGIIERSNYGKHQATLRSDKRKNNVADCFRTAKGLDLGAILKKEIILIDDVYTTGATMQECALVLKKAGFERIYGFALARG